MAKFEEINLNGKTTEVIQFDHTAQEIDNAVDAVGIESETYHGCYYRMVNSAQEWINPPLVAGEEYRTTERYMDKPVYVKLVNCGTGPDNTTKEILHIESPLTIVDYNGGFYSSNGDCIMIGWGKQSVLTINHSRIKITTAANYSAYTALVWMKYTKSTD